MCAPLLARLVRCFARMSVAKSRPCMPDVCTSGSKCVDKAWAWAKSQRPRANLALCSSCPASANSEHITHASSFITCVSHFAGHVLAHHALSRGLFVFGRRLPPGCSVNTTTVFPTVLTSPQSWAAEKRQPADSSRTGTRERGAIATCVVIWHPWLAWAHHVGLLVMCMCLACQAALRWRSSIWGVWAVPGCRGNLKTSRGAKSSPTFCMVPRPPGTARTPQIEDTLP